MTNAINQSPSLLELSGYSFINNQDLYDVKNENVRFASNPAIKNLWDRLKKSQDLKNLTSHLENMFIQKLEDHKKNIILSDERNKILEENVTTLFKSLANKFHRSDENIPVDLSSYLRLQKMEDESLQIIWDKKLSNYFKFKGRSPKTLNEIKLWLADPKNEDQLNKIDNLDLSQLGITVIPYQLTRLSRIQTLFLDDNQIETLPDFLSNFSKLQSLTVNHNSVRCLPESLSKLSQLETLYLDDNQISSFPESFGKLSKLQILSVSFNRLKSLPESFKHLSQLKTIFLDHNKIKSMPEFIGNLTFLELFYLHNNEIEKLPESFGNLPKLQSLHLYNNQIKSLPESFGNLSTLKHLLLDNNQIKMFPESFCLLSQLRTLFVADNPLLFIFDEKQIPFRTSEIISMLSDFIKYRCSSEFSKFYRIITLGLHNDLIKKQFDYLKFQDQDLINEMIANESALDLLHARENIPILCQAVKKAVHVKYDRLSAEQKKSIFKKIDETKPQDADAHCIEKHAFDNVLLLIDAMDQISPS